MKVIELRAANFKCLVAVEIRPDGNMVQLTGKNRQGKSAVLDALWAAFAGKDACPAVPIRQGADEAHIRVDCGDLIITRHFRQARDGGDYTTQISVENAEGARYPSPQAVLDRLLGELSFDPLEFARMKAAAQFNALRRFCPDVDFEAIANADRGDRERRTELGRFAQQERGAAMAITVPADTPEQPVDLTALIAELERAGEHNAQVHEERITRQQMSERGRQLQARARELLDRAGQLRLEMDHLIEEANKTSEQAQQMARQYEALPELPSGIDTSDIRRRIDAARATNANVLKLDERMKHHSRAHTLDQQVETLTASIKARQAQKEASIAAAQMPVEGLTLGDNQVLLNGLPFEQASDAEQLRVSVAIAMALNPKLRVIRIRDGSLLDEDALQLLAQMADQHDIQVWIERVDSTGKVGFVLEDGHVRHAAKQQQSEAASA